ncbi:MAG: hypothetical protein V2A53_02695 [bacterium]
MDKERRFPLTLEEIKGIRYQQSFWRERFLLARVSEVLGLSYVHIKWLKKRMKEMGLQGIMRKPKASDSFCQSQGDSRVV